MYPKLLESSKMERFATTVNAFMELGIIAKHAILNICWSPRYHSVEVLIFIYMIKLF